VCCSVLQCVAVCCSVLQCVAMCCSVLQCVAACCSIAHIGSVGVLQCVISYLWFMAHLCMPQCIHMCHDAYGTHVNDAHVMSHITHMKRIIEACCTYAWWSVWQRHTGKQESQKGDSFWGSPFWEESQKESPFSVARLWVADGGCDLVQASARGRGSTFGFRGRTVTWRRGSADLVVASTEYTWVLANCGSVWGRGRYSTLAAGSSIRGCWWWVYQVAYLGAVNKVAPFGVADGGCTYYNMYKDSPLIYITCMSYIRTRWYADSHTDILYVFCMHV